MPDTFFTTPPDWTWWIVPYFFVGGIAGGALAIGGMLQLVGRPADRPIVRMAYYIAFIGAVISGVLLVADLHRPERFWHMLIQSETGRPIFKWWSPMSFGSWALLLFSGVASLLALGAVYEGGVVRRRWLRPLSTGLFASVLAVAGILLGLFLAGYTGVLVSVSNRPVWADSNWLGMLFLFSGASTAAALLILLGAGRNIAPQARERLTRFDDVALVLEFIVLVIFIVSLGAAARVFLGWWGVLLVLGVVIGGILLPLAISRGNFVRVTNPHAAAASLVLVGGLLLRMAVLLSSESVHVAGSQVMSP